VTGVQTCALPISLPLRDAFAVLFFVSIGMLFDPAVLLDKPLQVLGVVAVIIVGKSLAAALLVIAFRYPLNTAYTVAASLAQIGEFSFILAGLGLSLGLLPEAGRSLIVAGALISIALNPLLFAAMEPARAWVLKRSTTARRLDTREDATAALPMSTERKYLDGQVVLVGYGRVGRRIAEAIRRQGIPLVVAEQNRELVEQLRSQGIPAVSGDAAEPEVLVQAHVAHAAMLVVAVPDPVKARRMLETARTLNPSIEVVLRTHSEDEAQLLARENGTRVFFAEEELAGGIANHVLRRFPSNG
jgi:CPA2 family monovalent cation:H+ antiporter-2